jgi:hypothetical protein
MTAFFLSADVGAGAHAAACFVRTHKWDAKVAELVTRLAAAAANFDFYVLYDVGKGPPPSADLAAAGVASERVVQTSQRLCAEADFYKGPGQVFYHCGDVALCHAMRLVPSYRLYAMIDWDVYFRPGREAMVAELFEKLAADPADFVGLQLQHNTTAPWYPAARKIFPQAACHYAYFPFVVLSRPLLALVYTQRQLHETQNPTHMDLVNGEFFVPSLAFAAGMRMHDLKHYVPNAYGKSIKMKGPGDMLGLPIEAVGLVTEDVAMLHPVLTGADYVERARRKFLGKDGPHIDRLRAHLARPEWAFVPAALTVDLRAAAAG